jgi:lipoyl(octanoyl) transferase
MDPLNIQWAAQMDYDTAWNWQKERVSQHQQNANLPDELLLLEHPPTYTLGRSGKLEHLLLTEEELEAGGFNLRWVDRGGDITYHGPGQLVGYPILNLRQLFARRGQERPDLHQYLRDLEEVLILTLAQFGLNGWRYPGYTGVWLDGRSGPEKIAAIGVRVSAKGISSHGFALNVNPNLEHFENIIPCGIREYQVTTLAKELSRPYASPDLLQPISEAFCQVFHYEAQYNKDAYYSLRGL